MKMLLSILLCLLLCGCTGGDPTPSQPLPAQPVPLSGQELADPYGSSVTLYPLPQSQYRSLRKTEAGLLLVSGMEDTTLTLLDEALCVQAESIQALEDLGTGLSFFDPEQRELVILDHTLQETRRITLPQELTGRPVLTPDETTIYYCTPFAIHAWDLDSGIRRRVKELSCDEQTLVALQGNGAILQCQTGSGASRHTLFLDSDTGSLLWDHSGSISLTTQDSCWYAAFPAGFRRELVFQTGAQARALYPAGQDPVVFFLPERRWAVAVQHSRDDTTLDLYDLDSGKRTASMSVDRLLRLNSMVYTRQGILMLVSDPEQARDCLLLWDPTGSIFSDSTDYTEQYHTADHPDTAGLALCRELAEELSQRYGIRILVGPEAVQKEPWDYRFHPEYQYRIIREQLLTLEQCLSRYPQKVLTQTAAQFQGLSICLVRSITGSTVESSLDVATGIQFLGDACAWVVVSAGPYQEQALYHELFHLMETRILSASGALDQWEKLNPAGFSYDLDYGTNASRNAGVYLQQGQRSFVDTYSMSFPREDRARVFEYAMLAEQTELFQEPLIQQKLQALCSGIREAYDLKDYPRELPWEQYLN